MSQTLATQLTAARMAAQRRRAEAFVDYRPIVCGMNLSPLTLATYTRLVAFESPFVVGGPITLEAIAVFVWVHHRDFGQNPRARREVFRAVCRALHPRFPNLNAFFVFAGQLPRFRWFRHFAVKTEAARYAEAIATIRHLVSDALCDMPADDSGDDEEGEEGALRKVKRDGPKVSLHAQIVNTFARTLHIAPAEAENLPLRRAVQLLREHMHHQGAGKGITLLSREEARVWADYIAEPAAA